MLLPWLSIFSALALFGTSAREHRHRPSRPGHSGIPTQAFTSPQDLNDTVESSVATGLNKTLDPTPVKTTISENFRPTDLTKILNPSPLNHTMFLLNHSLTPANSATANSQKMHPTAPTSQHTGSTRSLAPPTATPQSTFTSVTTGSSISEYTTASSSSSTSSAVSSPPTTVVRENSLAMIAIIVGSIAGILLILVIILLYLLHRRRRQRKAHLIAHPYLQNISDLSDGVFSKDRFVPRSPSRNSVEGITHVGNGDDTEPPESQQNTIVNPEPDHYPAAEMLREENERLRAENELLRLVGNGGHSQPKRISRFRLA